MGILIGTPVAYGRHQPTQHMYLIKKPWIHAESPTKGRFKVRYFHHAPNLHQHPPKPKTDNLPGNPTQAPNPKEQAETLNP